MFEYSRPSMGSGPAPAWVIRCSIAAAWALRPSSEALASRAARTSSSGPRAPSAGIVVASSAIMVSHRIISSLNPRWPWR